MIMPGNWTTTFTYNSSGELAAIVEPGGRTVTFTHDSSDNLIAASCPTAA